MTANQPVKSGISLVFNRPLVAKAEVLIKDSTGKKVKTTALEAQASRYNLELLPGVYQVSVSGANNSFPPTPESTVTVSEGVVDDLQLTLPAGEE